MTARRPLVLVVGLVLALTTALASRGSAGPDKIKYPAEWKNHVLYTTVDRYDIKQYRELYANTPAAVQAMKDGKPLPDGTVLTLVQYKAEVDAAGAPVKDERGRFKKGGTSSPWPSWRSGRGGAPSTRPSSGTASGSTRCSARPAC